VLFPRKEGKQRKGQVADTAKEVLDKLQVTQNISSELLPVPKPHKRERALKITDAMKNTKVFKVQRQEWANERWAGKRAKKAAEEEKKDQ